MTNPVSDYFQDGLLALNAGEYETAIALLTKAINLSLGDLSEIYLYRGEAYAYIERYEQAMADFNEALRHNAYLADAYNERGNILRLRGSLQLAIADYAAAITLAPNHYEAYYNRALTYEDLKQYRAAADDLTTVVALNPGVAPAYEARGRIRANLRDYDGAIADLERYLRMGGGREYDNHSEIQSYLINLRVRRMLTRILRRA